MVLKQLQSILSKLLFTKLFNDDASFKSQLGIACDNGYETQLGFGEESIVEGRVKRVGSNSVVMHSPNYLEEGEVQHFFTTIPLKSIKYITYFDIRVSSNLDTEEDVISR